MTRSCPKCSLVFMEGEERWHVCDTDTDPFSNLLKEPMVVGRLVRPDGSTVDVVECPGCGCLVTHERAVCGRCQDGIQAKATK